MDPLAEPVWLHHWVPENSGSRQCRCPQSLAIWRWYQLQQGGKWWIHGHGVRHQSSQSSNPACGRQHPPSRVPKDPVISTVMRHVREGWPSKNTETNDKVSKFRKLSDSLSTCHGCLIHGSSVVIPQSLQSKVLDLLHLKHFDMERMKQLARTAVYWPGIDVAIEMASRRCDSCDEHQNKPSKPPVHPRMLPEKPWSRFYLDHAINFMVKDWLVTTDACSKYPCIHPTSSTSTRTTLDLLEWDFAHFGFPHTLVTDNALTVTSEEFQHWCKERGITHLIGVPYHSATNGAAERLVQTFKKALRKFSLPRKCALQEFLMQYRRTPTSCGFSPSEQLNSRQARTRIDSLLPSPAHIAQGKQSKGASKSQMTPDSGGVAKVTRQYKAGDPVYALYHGPRRDKHPRWVPAIAKKPLHGYSLLQRQGRSWTVDGSFHGNAGDCTTDSETFQDQDCTTCPRVRTGLSQLIEKDT